MKGSGSAVGGGGGGFPSSSSAAAPPGSLMQKHDDITLERLDKFVSKIYFTDVNLWGKLYGASSQSAVTLSTWAAPDLERKKPDETATWKPTQVGAQFGPSWSTHWFRVEVEVPEEWEGKEVHFLWDSDSEACVWEDGVPTQGLTGGDGVDRRAEYILTKRLDKNHRHFSFQVEMACNGMFGNGVGGMIAAPRDDRYFTLKKAEVVVFNRNVWELLWDFITIADMAKHLPKNDTRAAQALWTANQMVNTCFPDDESTYAPTRAIAREFFAARNGDSVHQISAIGHCHIDTAWLWPYAETKRKIARSWATQIRYMDMEEYPDYKFVASQAQQHAWLKEEYPELFERIKQKISQGSFVPTGGSWVEMDCNIPSGESFVRQFLFGQRFFKQEYGSYCTEFWLPDTFGYSAQLPQLIRGAGMEFFLTQKLSWNLINKFPHHTFHWEGIDGSKVLAHFPPADTYNGNCSVEETLKAVQRFKDAARSSYSLSVYGHGDGGGGPQMEMLERVKRMQNVDGLPVVKPETPYQFFKKAERDQHKLITWVGELYFELHQGTYTSQAANKKGNRKSEFLLHNIEFLGSISASINGGDWKAAHYPQQELEYLWKLVLLDQFHDVLPGTSIPQVFEDTAQHYAEIRETSNRLIDCLCHQLSDQLSQANEEEKKKTGEENSILCINTTNFDRVEVVEVPSLHQEKDKFVQLSHKGNGLLIAQAPSYGVSIQTLTPASSSPKSVDVVETQVQIEGKNSKAFVMENDAVRVTVLEDGSIYSIVDKRCFGGQGREVVDKKRGKANSFVLFDDVPFYWDAWDVMVYHTQKRHPCILDAEASIVERGPLRARVHVKLQLTKTSTLEQYISLTANSARIDFETSVDWHENRKFLKVEFPLNVRAPTASYEIQFGHLQRPTHSNTSWDMAKFEVCGHKWADLSEHGYGVAILNDCKYGYACQENVMRLSLLRAPKQPDPTCDMGQHHFNYAIYPHQGTLQSGGVIEEGYKFNVPLLFVPTSSSLATVGNMKSFFSTEDSAAIIETVKKAEDSKDIILRIYEAFGGHCVTKLRSCLSVGQVKRCNLLEEEDASPPLSWQDGSVLISLSPFQVLTLRLSLLE